MKESLIEENGLYTLPLYQKVKFKGVFHILFLFIILLFIGFILIPGNEFTKVILNMGSLIFLVVFGYFWISTVFINKPYLIVTDKHLEYKWLFGHKIIKLDKIYQISFFVENGITKIGIWANDQSKPSFLEKIDRAFGRDYSVSIVVSSFQSIDFNKLRFTILSEIQSESIGVLLDEPDVIS
ncbi:MAG: hypothetical protein NAG76_16285 [Candidatus Pristimantibacillus lignocellulolyticus]|uniref:Uncharacterized protein n=1 Tax=Candidatus Pristimantibacillus lignocellulolyticus TaxID=2994561 RepID=A0A9J6ZBE1_9BACL|nr:MAG: hypothetical protein NAG76_16285 [Candidatus Pristimantibacillus lignocellulolyticus]